MPSSTPIAVSAPGKVLLAGGYLVLDKEYTGLVFGLSARISVVAREIKTSPGVQLGEIVVDSPQFLAAQWRYGYHLAPENGGFKVTQLHRSVCHLISSRRSRSHSIESLRAAPSYSIGSTLFSYSRAARRS